MKLSWNWLKDYITVKASPEEVADKLTMAGLEVKRVEKIGNDYLLETEVTSNRPDWLSHIGVAREIAALYNQKLKFPENKITSDKTARSVQVKTLAPKLCPYYSAMTIEGIESKKSPEWMTSRLSVCGIRSINLLVDVTNYVLLETGQPLHAFDLDRLQGEVSARSAKLNEKLVAIDGNQYNLNSDDIVIADNSGPIALGGVMGGKNSEVTDRTTNILIEAALFSPASVRKTSRRLKLTSESSYRFERSIDPAMIDFSRNRAAYLIAQNSKVGKIGLSSHAGKVLISKRSVSLTFGSIEKILGLVIPKAKVLTILNHLEIPTKAKGNKFSSAIPSFRPDITAEEDLIEEIARIYGFDRIPETIPAIKPAKPADESIINFQERARDLFVGYGLSEVVTFSIVNPAKAEFFPELKDKWVSVANPRNASLTLMRPSFSVSLIDAVKQNLNVGVKSVPVFEVAKRYLENGEKLPYEESTGAIMLAGEKPAGWMDGKRAYSFYDLKGMIFRAIRELRKIEVEIKPIKYGIYNSGESFELLYDGKWMGMIGSISKAFLSYMDIDKPVYYGAISLTNLFALSKKTPKYKDIPKFPSTERDMALLIDEEISADNLVKCISSLGKGLIQKVELFDLYRGGKLPKGKKSVAFHINYQSSERTLETEEVNRLHFSIVDELNKQFKAELPSKA